MFKPNVFFYLSQKNIDDKCQALKFYESEIKKFPYPRSEKGLKTLAMFRGMQVGTYYAEAFQLIKNIKQ